MEILPANIIAESIILSQVEEEGHKQMMLNEIIDHRSTNQVKRVDGYVHNPYNNSKGRKKTTKGWELCVQWKDDSLAWIPLKDMKMVSS